MKDADYDQLIQDMGFTYIEKAGPYMYKSAHLDQIEAFKLALLLHEIECFSYYNGGLNMYVIQVPSN